MKEIVKERTKVETYSIYQAADGTVFDTKEECEKYEQTARFVLNTKFKRLVVKETTEWDLFHAGSDDNIVYAVRLEKGADVDTVMQLYCHDNSWINQSEGKYKEEAYNLIYGAFRNGDILFVGENYDGEIYLISTRNKIIDNLNKIEADNENT